MRKQVVLLDKVVMSSGFFTAAAAAKSNINAFYKAKIYFFQQQKTNYQVFCKQYLLNVSFIYFNTFFLEVTMSK